MYGHRRSLIAEACEIARHLFAHLSKVRTTDVGSLFAQCSGTTCLKPNVQFTAELRVIRRSIASQQQSMTLS